MIISIHQPEHTPWLGWYNKMINSDYFIILDDCQYRKNYFQNRNRIVSPRGLEYITVPVQHGLVPINEVRIADVEWKRKYLGRIREAYSNAPQFDTVYPCIESIINKEYELLIDINMALIRYFRELLKIHTPMRMSSTYDISSTGSLRIAQLVEMCAHSLITCGWGTKISVPSGTGAQIIYLSGPSGRDYLDIHDFSSRGIEVVFHDYKHPNEIVEYASVIDLVMRYESIEARNILSRGGTP